MCDWTCLHLMVCSNAQHLTDRHFCQHKCATEPVFMFCSKVSNWQHLSDQTAISTCICDWTEIFTFCCWQHLTLHPSCFSPPNSSWSCFSSPNSSWSCFSPPDSSWSYFPPSDSSWSCFFPAHFFMIMFSPHLILQACRPMRHWGTPLTWSTKRMSFWTDSISPTTMCQEYVWVGGFTFYIWMLDAEPISATCNGRWFHRSHFTSEC